MAITASAVQRIHGLASGSPVHVPLAIAHSSGNRSAGGPFKGHPSRRTLPDQRLNRGFGKNFFNTDRPSRILVEALILEQGEIVGWTDNELMEAGEAFCSEISRGECRHLICYADNQPSEIFFMGYSFD